MRRPSAPFAPLFAVLAALVACGDDGPSPGMDGDAGRDASTTCTSTSDCDDGLYCNGVEICAPRTAGVDDRGCGRGTPPCPASEACVETSDSCAACSDDDADGDGVSLCDFDCDDADATRHPGATELCDADARDEDCNPATFGFLDVDGDGYSANTCCNGTTEPRACGTDCDPGRPSVHPDASEVCDTLDNDCDGTVDEDVTRTFHPDADGDGFGDPAAAAETGCTPPTGFVEDATDCDDTVAARNPGAPETCDGIDNDCDTVVDDSIGRIFYRDADHDGYGLADTTIEACSRPADYADRPGDCDDGAPARSPVLPEVCDGIDNDCDGAIDDSAASAPWYRDADGDGHGNASDVVSNCAPLTGRVLLPGDCDDADASRNPAAPEVCDTVDNDCDAIVDDGVALPYYRDTDGDGFGVATDLLTACARPTGYSPLAGDCDDGASQRSPALPEFCDGVDNDCDGVVDDGIALPVWYRDADADGYGRADVTSEACARPSGYRDVAGDCDDTLSARNPAAPEVCDAIDNDCDLIVDDGVLQTFYRDADLDGHGTMAVAAPGATTSACAQPSGYAAASTDCDDTDPSRNPAAPEVCDTVDNDCNALVDDGVGLPFYRDTDADGYGVATDLLTACARPTGYSPLAGDCDDTASQRSPALPEFCDGVDNDCDGVVDDGIALPVWYRDADADGYGRADVTSEACARPSGYREVAGDCDDTNASRNPAAPEVCDSVDNDCDLIVDDGVLQTFYRDADLDGYGTMAIAVPGATTRACAQPVGYAAASTDCDDTRASRNPGAPEVCDGVDNNCNGLLDYPGEDPDGDGHTISACGGSDCDNTRADVYVGASELCDGRDNDCDGLLGVAEDVDRDGRARVACGGSDCNDANATVYAGAPERCDGLDNDCNGAFDGPGEDVDGDRYVAIACGGTDCNDANGAIHPGVTELCDAVDNDCNGTLLTGEDDDGDLYADIACGGTDCDDARASVHPGADEGCDGLDTDCGGGLGAGEDVDRDGAARSSCGALCVGACGDCDDARAEVHLGAAELCDGRDDDCNALMDGPGEDDDRDGYANVACGAACTASCTDCDDTRDFVHPNPPPRDCDGFDNDCDGITDEVEGPYGAAYPELGASEMSNRIVVNGAIATLVATDVSGGSRNIVLAQFSTVDGAIVTPRRFLMTSIDDEDQARISPAGSGYVIVYLSNASGVNAVHWERLDSTGTSVAGPVVLTTGTAVSRPSLAVGGAASDRALVVFAQDGVARRMTVRNSDGVILAPAADLGPGSAVDTETVWDPTSARFGALVTSWAGGSAMLHRVDASGTVTGTDDVGLVYTIGYVHIAAADGQFLVSRWNGEPGVTLRYWSSGTGPASAMTVVPAPLGGLQYGQMMGISPTNIWVGWNGALSVRRRSDLGPYTGAFASSMVGYMPGSMTWSNGLMVGSTTHNGSYAVVIMATCR